MARRRNGSVPGLRHHKPSGQAVVTLSGQDFYCGPCGTKTALAEFDRQVAQWLARGRRPLLEVEELGGLTLVELIAAYKRYAEAYYRKYGKPTSEVYSIVSALRVVRELYGREPVAQFGPLKLQAVQQAMIRKGWCRSVINKHTWRIVRMVRWGVKQELVEAQVAHALREVGGLHKGRTDARETTPVKPVAEAVINATLSHLPALVADMVRFQRLTGCRPEEVCLVRPSDVDTSREPWSYRPHSHKTEHHGRDRVIFIGPKARDVLRPYLLRDKTSYCFCPEQGERKRRQAAHERRVTPANYGNSPGTNRKANPKRPAGARYDVAAYRRAICRACELAFKMPERLRMAEQDETPEQKAERLRLASRWRRELLGAEPTAAFGRNGNPQAVRTRSGTGRVGSRRSGRYAGLCRAGSGESGRCHGTSRLILSWLRSR